MKLEDNINLIHFAARKSHKRMLAMQISVDYEDVFQDAAEIWLKCQSRFKPQLGLAFSTYFISAVNHSIIRTSVNGAIWAMTQSLDEVIEDTPKFEIADSTMEAELLYSSQEAIERVEAKLSPLAKRIFELLIDPPTLVTESFIAAQSKAELSRKQGLDRRASVDLTVTSLCNLLQIETTQRCEIAREIKEALNEL